MGGQETATPQPTPIPAPTPGRIAGAGCEPPLPGVLLYSLPKIFFSPPSPYSSPPSLILTHTSWSGGSRQVVVAQAFQPVRGFFHSLERLCYQSYQ
jgi:hypothetical protein